MECEIFAKFNKKFIDKKILVLYNEITVYNIIKIRKADEQMTNLFAAIDIFNINIVACAIVLGVALLLAVLLLVLRCHVIYYDSEDGNYEIHKEKHPWLKKVGVHSASKKGKRLVGWSKQPGGKNPLTKHHLVLFRTVKLYAIWAEAPVIEPVVEPKAAIPVDELDYSEGVFVKFNYVDTQTEEIIASEGFRLNASVPTEDVEGWGFTPDGEVLFKDGQENYVFAINLYPVAVTEDSDTVVSNEDFNGESVVDISYTMSATLSVADIV